jgi:hypothetical protein
MRAVVVGEGYNGLVFVFLRENDHITRRHIGNGASVPKPVNEIRRPEYSDGPVVSVILEPDKM